MPDRHEATQALVDIGLTNVEAEVYAFLLQESPATGYRIAQGLSRSVGNVYKALETLGAKGAVLIERAETRLVRAVAPEEFLRQMERAFARRREDALGALNRHGVQAHDEGVYHLRSREQVFERVRSMLTSAEQFVIATLCPDYVPEMGVDFEAVAARGLPTGVKLFEFQPLVGVQVVVDPRGLRAVESGPGQWMFLTVDGRDSAWILFSTGLRELHQAVWSANALLAWNMYTGLSSDLLLAALRAAMSRGAGLDELRAISSALAPLETPRSRGKQMLLQRYRGRGRPPSARPREAATAADPPTGLPEPNPEEPTE